MSKARWTSATWLVGVEMAAWMAREFWSQVQPSALPKDTGHSLADVIQNALLLQLLGVKAAF